MFGSPRRCDRWCFGERPSLLVRRRSSHTALPTLPAATRLASEDGVLANVCFRPIADICLVAMDNARVPEHTLPIHLHGDPSDGRIAVAIQGRGEARTALHNIAGRGVELPRAA